MKKLLWILLCLVFTSCIEIVQEIQLKKNGSGTAVYTMNMSKMKDMMESLQSLGGDAQDTDLGNTDKQFAEYAENLKTMEGISKVKFTSKDFVYQISFQFKNLATLNKALTYLNNGKGGVEQKIVEYVKVDKKQIIVKNSNEISKANLKEPKPKSEDNEMGDTIVEDKPSDPKEDTEWIKSFFNDATYTTIVQVYAPILSNSHPLASVNGKKVTLKLPILELDKSENSQNIITLK